ncbi:tetratricopeptide repeat protein [Candidatus Poribacteria bacterium]|nr:tetratricopeptide repeat protein [Candidatus Poribacteria bacterium]
MLTGMQTVPKVVLPPGALEIPSIPQLLDNSKLLQTRTSQPAGLPIYAGSDYHWLVGVLDKLIKFMRRDENHNVSELTENDYDWAHTLLIELTGAVGENKRHPLRPLMEFVCQLIDNYEDKYVPEPTELFPELAKEVPIETASKSKQPTSNIPQLSDTELAANAFFSIGHLLYQGNRTENAILAYDKASALKPDFWEAFYNRGIVRYDLGQYPEAMTDFNQVIKLNYDFAGAYHNRGISYSRLDQHTSAIADFDKAIELGLNSFEVYCHRAFAKTALDKYDAAVSDYDKAIELNQDLVEVYEVYNILGILRSELGQYNEALANYAEAIRIKPDYAEAYAYRGVLKAYLGRINKAKLDFKKALELAKRPGNSSRLKVFVEDQLQQLDQVASKQNNKKPRRGGQWKGKVRISEDFDELPESFVTVTSEEDE